MDDSDDLFDDLVLDDAAIAALEAQEQRYISQTQKSAPSLILPLPPAKRLKTDTGWRPSPAHRRTDINDELYELPDIILKEDGSYDMRPKESKKTPGAVSKVQTPKTAQTQRPIHKQHATAVVRPNTPALPLDLPPNTRAGLSGIPPSLHNAPTTHLSDPSSRNPPIAHSQTAKVISNATSHSRSTSSNSSRPPSSRQLPKSRTASINPSPLNGHVTINSTGVAPSLRSLDPSVHSPGTQTSSGGSNGIVIPSVEMTRVDMTRVDTELQAELAAIRSQLEETRNQLQAATSEKYAKAGEVSTLRRALEKTGKEATEQILKLKAEKEASDLKILQSQREAKEEIERLKTQNTFKQHEIESSNRKAPWSTQKKRQPLEMMPATPGMPSQRKTTWNQSSQAGPSRIAEDTPKPPRGFIPSPKSVRIRKNFKVETMPGFHNSFASSTPLRPVLARAAKDKTTANNIDHSVPIKKGKAREVDGVFDTPSQFRRKMAPPSSPGSSSPTRPGSRGRSPDFEMIDGSDFGADINTFGVDVTGPGSSSAIDPSIDNELAEELEEPLNWRDELYRMIMTHAVPDSPVLTIQTILQISLPGTDPFHTSAAESLSYACSSILEALAPNTSSINLALSISTIVKSLLTIAKILLESDMEHFSSLAGIMHLLTALCYHIPSFSAALVTPDGTPETDDPRKLHLDFGQIISKVIGRYLHPATSTKTDKVLTKCVLALLEAVSYNVPDSADARLDDILKTGVFTILLHRDQPSWILHLVTRILSCLATRLYLYRSLLSSPDPVEWGGDGDMLDVQKLTHVERLCSYIIDLSLDDVESHLFKGAALTFFSTLAMVHPDALVALLDCQTLVPSLVVYISQLTTPLWNDNEALVDSPETTMKHIRHLHEAIQLLHYLIHYPDPIANLRNKIYHARSRQFNGLVHIFTVTFGRLSYARPPEWISSQGVAELEQLTEPAAELLELVFDGPEGDVIFAAFEAETDQNSITDDDEMEARLMDDMDVGS